MRRSVPNGKEAGVLGSEFRDRGRISNGAALCAAPLALLLRELLA
jgi:hypothetical protein